MTAQTERRRLAMARRKSARVGIALGNLQRALEEGDAQGDERIMRAMTELIQWRKDYGNDGA